MSLQPGDICRCTFCHTFKCIIRIIATYRTHIAILRTETDSIIIRKTCYVYPKNLIKLETTEDWLSV